MRMINAVRSAALVTLLAALPAPASAQLGFIKKQLKQKIVQTVVDSAVSRVTGPADSAAIVAPAPTAPTADSSAASATASGRIGGFLKKRIGQKILHTPDDSSQGGAAGQSRPRAGAGVTPPAGSAPGGTRVAAAPRGPQFDELVVEITPKSLDQLEKFLAAQAARRQGGGDSGAAALGTAFSGDQLSMVRFSLMTQRVVAYCSVTEPGETAAAMRMYGSPTELENSFTPKEIATLRPRCPRLMALLKTES